MAQTYTQIQRQIEALQKQAEKLKATEVAGVVDRIKVAISHYGLTTDQLFGTDNSKGKTPKTARKNGASGGKAAAAYADDAGNTWGGRGPRPRWLHDALAAGKSLEDFETTPTTATSTPSAAKKISKRKAKASYRDQAGHVWSGFGPKPRWLKEAMAAGATLEQLAG